MDLHRTSFTRSLLWLTYMIVFVLSVPVLSAQGSKPAAIAKPLAFEVADVHPSPYVFTGRYFHMAPLTRDRFVVRQATLLDLISTAYSIEADAVAGGPPGLEFDRYDIVASIPPGTTQADTRLMLQTLLAERFKLVIKTEMTPLPAFLLRVGKGAPKLKAAVDATGDGSCRYQVPDPPPPPNTPPPPTITLGCSHMTMEQLAQEVRGMGGLNHPVMDRTDLKGGWDFDLRYSWQPGAPGAVTIYDSLDKLGLKLEASTAPRQGLTIVSMAENSTPNIAEIEKLLPPPPPPAFEVAVIRPSKQESKDIQIRFSGGDQVTVSTTLIGLIGYAWGISTTTVFNTPPFVDNQVWDITGKLPALDTAARPGGPRIDIDQVRLMLRSLLTERFGLKTHNEDRPGSGYTLLVAGPKLKKADPGNRSSCDGRPAPGEKNPRAANPLLTRYIRCQNVTVDQFARELQGYALDTIKTPVLNATDLEGRYDITLSWSDARTLASPQPAAGIGAGAAPGESAGVSASEPAGVPVSLQDALLKQLGLKLQLQKRAVSALVVDHLEEKPTDN